MVLEFGVRLCSFFTFRPVKSGLISSPPLGRCPYSGNVEPWLPSVNQGSRRLPDWTIRPPLWLPFPRPSRSPTYTSTCFCAFGEDLDLQRLPDDSTSFSFSIGAYSYTTASEIDIGRNRKKITACAICVFLFTVWLVVFVSPYLYYTANLGPMLAFIYAGIVGIGLCLVM
jgi:hypothetical protein